MNKETLEKYAALKIQQKSIEEEIAKLNPVVLEMIEASGADKVSAEGVGSFSIAKRKTWKFSKNVEQAEESLEELKAREKASGDATAEEKPYLLFKVEKSDENSGD